MNAKARKAYVKPMIDEEAVFVPESSACAWMPQSVYLSHHSGEACGIEIDPEADDCAPVGAQWWNSTP